MNESAILSLISRLRRQANRFIENELRERQIEGIAPSHGDILVQLYQQPSVTMQELSKLIDRDKSTVTVLVEKLVKHGYVCKKKDAEDGRIYRLSVTAKGRTLQPAFKEISERLIATVYRDFTAVEKKQLCSLLRKISM